MEISVTSLFSLQLSVAVLLRCEDERFQFLPLSMLSVSLGVGEFNELLTNLNVDITTVKIKRYQILYNMLEIFPTHLQPICVLI